ncbi:LPXTG cell wall anchor domain-containing protein [Micromonospora sp. NPDC049559]|uniref:LPXTG cell wall anchor domain-containing protein n=1 Tax=Micromonospora sp. NPDC049559 TaxID=3155923 RepID=UPI00342FBCC9
MIRPKLSLRRSLAVAGATFIGLAAALAVAAPASAHHSEVKVKSECETATGEWVLTWTVNSYAPSGVRNYRLSKVDAKQFAGGAASAASIPGIEVAPRGQYPYKVGTPLVKQQRLPGNATGASLTVRSQWDNGYNEDSDKSASIRLSGGCAKVVTPPPATANPKASMSSDCTGDIAVELVNTKDATKDAQFTVTTDKGFKKTVKVSPDADETVKIPAAQAGTVKVTEAGQKQPLINGVPDAATDCVKPGQPAGSNRSTCTELVVEVSNPADGQPVTVTYTSNKGETKTVEVAPGQTGTAKFPASEGLTVTPSGGGIDSKPIAWVSPSADCGGEGGGGTLPLTGAAAGSIAAGAAVLLAIGVVLFVVARRRKIRFTA